MSARERILETRRSLLAIGAVRAVGIGAGVAMGTVGVAHLFEATGARSWAVAVVAGAAAGTVVWWCAGTTQLTAERTALWVEERHPELQYALVSVLTSGALDRGDPSTGGVSWTRDLRNAWRRSALVALLAASAGAVILGLAGPVVRFARALNPPSATGRGRVSAPFSIRVDVQPPAYSGQPSQRLVDPATVRALSGSVLALSLSDSSGSVRLDGAALTVARASSGALAVLRMPALPAALQLTAPTGRRLVALDAIADSAPGVTLTAPVRDTVVREARGSLPLAAELHDDIGLARGAFEYIVSSGEGESFAFRSGRISAARFGGPRSASLRGSLGLDALQLKPGDLVHVRAVAQDANDVTGPGIGTSETRTIRIARQGEYDSVAVEGAASGEAQKSVLSERMLINTTEALLARRRPLAATAFTEESQKIGRDQTRLRRQVGDLIFARLSGEAPSEEGGAGDESERDLLTKDALLKAAEAATQGKSGSLDFEQDESPVVAVSRPLLEAYNAMWDAGRALNIGEAASALPHMRRALAAIQRARAAERLYLRGKPPRTIVDVAKVRLQGKEPGTPTARLPRHSADSVAAPARARFASALALLSTSPLAATDSLVVLRIALLARMPEAAGALDAAVGALRSGGDATALLRRARRALDDAWVTRDSVSAWSSVR